MMYSDLNKQYQDLLESIDILFAEVMYDYMTEQGMYEEIDFEEDMYLQSFSDEEKLQYITKVLG